jgi:hypothetical protein
MGRRGLVAVLGSAVGIAALVTAATTSVAAPATFSTGQLSMAAVGASGCGTNPDGEPSIHVSGINTVLVGSERGLGGGSDAWRGVGQVGGASAQACQMEYRGQPNAVQGAGASGGDIDTAIGSATAPTGFYPIYIASLNLGSVSVAHSTDNGTTFTNVPVQGGLPVDDREWIAAYGASGALLTFHDIATNNIDVLRSDNGGTSFTQISQAIPATDYKATNNQIGNIVIDHRNLAGTGGVAGFWAYQSFVAPSSNPGVLGGSNNEAFLAVSNDGGYSWTDRPVPCSTSNGSLNHQFPNVSVAPDGSLWMTWSDGTKVFTAKSSDHGSTWTCSGSVSTTTAQAVMPWIVATSAGVDLVFYGSPAGPSATQTWYVEFAGNATSTATGWASPQQVVAVHKGTVCEGGVSCTSGRQLLDDFGVDTDQQGWAHIAYSHDSPDLGGSGTYTGYAVQTSGTQFGYPN